MKGLKQVRQLLVGRWSPFLISAAIVVGFAAPQWLEDTGTLDPSTVEHSASCSVERLIDGDTVDVVCADGRARVRLWGIDAPELGQTPWGRQATHELGRLTDGHSLKASLLGRDVYGRVLARMFRDDKDVGLEMVRAGWANIRLRYVKDAKYRAARIEARRAHRGIWARPGFQQRPWEWRRINPPQA